MGILFAKPELSFDYGKELAEQKELQSVEVKGEEEEGYGPIHRHAQFPDALIATPHKEGEAEPCDTLYKAFLRGVDASGDGNMLGTRKAEGKEQFGDYEWMSYNDAKVEAEALGAGLAELGVARGGAVGVCSVNRAEWVLTALGIYSQGMVTVALYDTFGEEAIEYIINSAETSVVACSVAKLPLMLDCIPNCGGMKHIIVFDKNGDEVPAESREAAKEKGVEVHSFSEVVERGKASGKGPAPPAADDIAFNMFTSGTTGLPKGVLLTHGNCMAAVAGVDAAVVKLRPDDVHFSYLPLAHIFETAVQAAIWNAGASMGFFSGHVKRLTLDLGALRPTLMPGVPRVFSKIYDKLIDTVTKKGGVGAFLFNKALAQDTRKVRRGEKLERKGFSQGKVFHGVRGKLGLDRCRIMITGAAPCPPYLMEFLKVVVNPPDGVVQGYGLTETAAGLCVTAPSDHTLGHVGPPLPSVEIRLRSVPEMGYLAEEGKGEILARGPSITQGYYKNDEATAKTIKNGWLHTGDVGRWNPNGTLSVIGRVKALVKMAQGEYVAVERLEGIYGRHPGVNQIFIYANSYKTKVTAVVVPAWAYWYAHFKKEKKWGDGPAADETNPELSEEFRAHYKKTVEENREAMAKQFVAEFAEMTEEAGLRGFERVAAVHVDGDVDILGLGFTVERDLLTPTYKLRRPFLAKYYLEPLQALYTELGEAPRDDEHW